MDDVLTKAKNSPIVAGLTSLRQGFGGPPWLQRRRKAPRSITENTSDLAKTPLILCRLDGDDDEVFETEQQSREGDAVP